MARNTKIQLRRGTASQWTTADPVLAEGEIGYEIDTGRFKIGKTGGTQWSLLPYAGNTEIIAESGIGAVFDPGNNRYIIQSIIEPSGTGLSVEKIELSGDGLTAPSGSYYKIGLDDRLQALADNNNSGILVGTNESGIITRSLSEGSNIDITNADGIEGNPTIGLSDDITLNSIDATGTVGINVSGNVNISGTLTVSNLSFLSNETSLILGDVYSYGSGIFEDGLYVGIGENATSVVLESRNINTENGITGGGSLSGDLTLGLTGQAKNFHDLATKGFVVRDTNNDIVTRGLVEGNNIDITNPSGISDNPIIALSASLTGLTDITVGTGTFYDLGVTNNIVGSGSISGVTVYANSGIFQSGVTIGGTGVTLEGHTHDYADITDFCDGVASCVDTALSASTGIQFNYDSGNDRLNIALSGQALALHNFNSNGILVRTSESNFAARTISPSGSNILVGDGDGVSNNPTIGLNPVLNVTSLDATGDVVIGGNLTVNGSTVTTNVETVTIEDPSITIGSYTGVMSTSDEKDRGIEFVYQTGNSVPITGFFGYDHSSGVWTFLNPATNTNGVYSGTEGVLKVGGLVSSGGISGTVLTSTVTGDNAPLAVSASGLVTNLNADLLDGKHGSHYLDYNNFSNTPTIGDGQLSLGISGTGLSGSATFTANQTSGSTFTVSSNATPACVTGAIVARDSNGNFCANEVNLSSISGNVSIPHPTGGTIPTPTYGSTSISGVIGVAGAPDTYLLNFVIDGGSP